MRAVQFGRYGPADVLEVKDEVPPSAGRGRVLVRVEASSINPKDTFVRKGRFRRLTGRRFPLPSGYDAAGFVEASSVPAFSPGDRVFGMLNGWRGGAAAELVAWPAGELATAPRSIPLADAAALPLAGLTALQALRDHLRVAPGRSVLINGASGGVGSFAVQIAKALGAEVIATCSARRAAHVLALGADGVHDYAESRLPEGRFDAVFDVFGNLSAGAVVPVLAPAGRYVTTVPSPGNIRAALALWRRPRTRIVNVRSRSRDLWVLADMVDAGRLRVVVERRYDVGDVAEAHRHIERKHTLGKVLLTFGDARRL